MGEHGFNQSGYGHTVARFQSINRDSENNGFNESIGMGAHGFNQLIGMAKTTVSINQSGWGHTVSMNQSGYGHTVALGNPRFQSKAASETS